MTSPWRQVLSVECAVKPDSFLAALEIVVGHPEYNSSSILRSDSLADSSSSSSSSALVRDERWARVLPGGFEANRAIRRRLVPKRAFDGELEQDCIFCQAQQADSADDEASLLVLLLADSRDIESRVAEGKTPLPFYHPEVHGIAFLFTSSTISILILPLEGSPVPDPIPPASRLYRTSMALAKNVASISKGHEAGYEKRVHHDLLTPKEEVQDLYLVLKERYRANLTALFDPRLTFRYMLNEWQEDTDPKKHVFEDLAIASWLIVLWRSMYASSAGAPPGGFVDVGCGNGLLVFVLQQEGYTGYGIDLRARKSWPAYKPPPDCRVSSLDPPALLSMDEPPFPPNAFLIGNHADELTPWIPLFAAATPGAAFLNIPCCLHELHGRFTRDVYRIPPSFLSALDPSPIEPIGSPPPEPVAKNALLLPFYAPTPSEAMHQGRYFAFQLFLAHITLACGFIPEREALRIPSTKNFGMLGRKRLWEGPANAVEWTEEQIAQEKERVSAAVRAYVDEVKGVWKARTPEGKAGH